MTRGATLFSGGRGVEAMLADAVDFALACEYDAEIAAVGAQLGGQTIVGDVCEQDFTAWGALDYLHASPVCTNASQAKKDGTEDVSDVASADAVVRCLEATRPRVFTLENVQGYLHFEAYRRICRALDRLGYFWHAETLNAANYGVPQTRRRLILRAVKDALLPSLPDPMSWVGWYGAIEDLIPTLPASAFAPWQLARLGEMEGSFIVAGNGNQLGMPDGGSVTDRDAAAPYFTITASCDKTPARAWLVSNAGNNYDDGDALTMRADTDPAHSVSTQAGGRVRAFLIGGGNTNATVIDSKPRDMDDPAFTITHASVRDRAWLAAGRVVKMTPRALARFQSLPDWYVLPERNSLACKIVGNMVPSLLMRKIVLPLLGKGFS